MSANESGQEPGAEAPLDGVPNEALADEQVASDSAAFGQAIKEGEVEVPVRATRAQRDGAPVLELKGVSTHYGLVSVLRDVNVEIFPGEIVCLLGGNASGKTTTLKTILGMVVPSQGEVRLAGETVSGMPITDIVSRGISMVPENRRLFATMTVLENLELGAYLRKEKTRVKQDLDRVL